MTFDTAECRQRPARPLLGVIVGTTIALTLVHLAAFIYLRHSRALLELPWFNPVASSLAGLATFSVAFLSFGRYKVMRDPPSYWIGMGFATASLSLVFHVLMWPGLLTGGQAIVGHSQNIALWAGRTAPIVLAVCLFCAVLTGWPGEHDMPGRRWVWSVAGWLSFMAVLQALLLVLENHLPVLVQPNGVFTRLSIATQLVLAVVLGVGAIFSTVRYVKCGDARLGYVALCQIAYVFTELALSIGARRYDFWWYVSRVSLLSSFLVVLLGLLYEYLGLLRAEHERTRELQAKSAELEAALRALSADMQRRKQAEEALIRNEKLAATGRLAAVIAHEINNPLAAMTNIVYLLEKSVSDPRAQEYVKMIGNQLQTVTRVANQTLKFHRQNGLPAEFSLAEIVADLLAFFQPKAKQHGVTICPRAETEGRLVGFSSEIQQVISNLLTNAIEATPDGGRVTVRLHASIDWRNPHTSGYRCTIVDTGSGIEPEHRLRIFEPFFTTKGERGTGLGLWVSMGIVQRAGGSMRAWSTQRQGRSGTCFSVFLPAVSPLARPDPHPIATAIAV